MNATKKFSTDKEISSRSEFINAFDLTNETAPASEPLRWRIIEGGKFISAGTAATHGEAAYRQRTNSKGHIFWHYNPLEPATGQADFDLDIEVDHQLADKIERLFRSAKRQVFEDGVESPFSKELVSIIETVGVPAVSVLKNLIQVGDVNEEVASEALRWLGLMEDEKTHTERRILLEQALTSDSSRIRDGAAIGLSYLADPQSIGYLKRAEKKERSPMLRDFMQEVIKELQGIN